MAISRWERGEQEPTNRAYIELGNLAGNPKCWQFWGRAGLHSENLLRVMPEMRERLQTSSFGDLEIVRAGSGAQKTHLQKQKLVAIPLLKVVAAAHGETGSDPSSLLVGPVESMIAAPRDWCPNPATTRCLRVRGNSMSPLIQDGYIVAVDSSQNDQIQLNEKIVIAWHKDRGLTVTRFRRFDHTEVLEPENHEYGAITLSAKQRWTILAKVLWWIAMAP
jgi:SOS-response transcriptional repressor LexA